MLNGMPLPMSDDTSLSVFREPTNNEKGKYSVKIARWMLCIIIKRFVCFLGLLKHLMLCVLLVSAASHPVRSEMFTESGVVDIPTGNILSHGTFGTGIFISYPRWGSWAQRYELNAVAFRFNFGVFDKVEVGLRYLSNTSGSGPDAVRSAHLKLQLLKEQESEMFPSVAIGVENLSDTIVSPIETGDFCESELWYPGDYEPDPYPSTFLAMSKTFRHLYCVHLGVATGENGVFVGLSRRFQPAFARGDITINFEVNGLMYAGINAGIQYAMSSGLQIALGLANMNSTKNLRYLAAVSWNHE